ncbi:ferric reductase-like transmembrane domain-containing protein [Pseudomonas aeruginosa]
MPVKLLWGVLAAALAAMGPDAGRRSAGEPGHLGGAQAVILLTGVVSFALMTLIMLLAVRPVWLEKPLDGLDRMYRLHKWAGIPAIVLGLLHYLLELAGPWLAGIVGKPVKGPRVETFLDVFRGSAKSWVNGRRGFSAGCCWSLSGSASRITSGVMCTRRWPWSTWYWPSIPWCSPRPATGASRPAGWWRPCALLGSACALLSPEQADRSHASPCGRGHRRRAARQSLLEGDLPAAGRLVAQGRAVRLSHLRPPGGCPSVHHRQRRPRRGGCASASRRWATTPGACRTAWRSAPGSRWRGHTAASTSAVAWPGGRSWVAAGIGVTPFIAWLESLQAAPRSAPSVELHYCVRSSQEALFAGRLRELCRHLPSVTLHIHYSDGQGKPQAGATGRAEERRRTLAERLVLRSRGLGRQPAPRSAPAGHAHCGCSSRKPSACAEPAGNEKPRRSGAFYRAVAQRPAASRRRAALSVFSQVNAVKVSPSTVSSNG